MFTQRQDRVKKGKVEKKMMMVKMMKKKKKNNFLAKKMIFQPTTGVQFETL